MHIPSLQKKCFELTISALEKKYAVRCTQYHGMLPHYMGLLPAFTHPVQLLATVNIYKIIMQFSSYIMKPESIHKTAKI